MEFRCFNGMNNCDYCGSCHSEFNARSSDEKRHIYNQALEDFFNKCSEENIQFYLNPIDCMREVKEQLKR